MNYDNISYAHPPQRENSQFQNGDSGEPSARLIPIRLIYETHVLVREGTTNIPANGSLYLRSPTIPPWFLNSSLHVQQSPSIANLTPYQNYIPNALTMNTAQPTQLPSAQYYSNQICEPTQTLPHNYYNTNISQYTPQNPYTPINVQPTSEMCNARMPMKPSDGFNGVNQNGLTRILPKRKQAVSPIAKTMQNTRLVEREPQRCIRPVRSNSTPNLRPTNVAPVPHVETDNGGSVLIDENDLLDRLEDHASNLVKTYSEDRKKVVKKVRFRSTIQTQNEDSNEDDTITTALTSSPFVRVQSSPEFTSKEKDNGFLNSYSLNAPLNQNRNDGITSVDILNKENNDTLEKKEAFDKLQRYHAQDFVNNCCDTPTSVTYKSRKEDSANNKPKILKQVLFSTNDQSQNDISRKDTITTPFKAFPMLANQSPECGSTEDKSNSLLKNSNLDSSSKFNHTNMQLERLYSLEKNASSNKNMSDNNEKYLENDENKNVTPNNYGDCYNSDYNFRKYDAKACNNVNSIDTNIEYNFADADRNIRISDVNFQDTSPVGDIKENTTSNDEIGKTDTIVERIQKDVLHSPRKRKFQYAEVTITEEPHKKLARRKEMTMIDNKGNPVHFADGRIVELSYIGRTKDKNILTHVVDGHVFQESDEAFPIQTTWGVPKSNKNKTTKEAPLTKSITKNESKPKRRYSVQNFERVVMRKRNNSVKVCNCKADEPIRPEPQKLTRSPDDLENGKILRVELSRAEIEEKSAAMSKLSTGQIENQKPAAVAKSAVGRPRKATGLASRRRSEYKKSNRRMSVDVDYAQSTKKKNFEPPTNNPFDGLTMNMVEEWSVKQLAEHLSKYGDWLDAATLLFDNELDGECVLLVTKRNLLDIGLNEEHANVICEFNQEYPKPDM